jgi:phage terminase large subunit-like protein
VINDPTFLPLIYAADDADEWTDERVWAKANPSLGHTFGVDYLRSECEEAKNSPSRELSFRRLYLNQWIFQKAARYLSDTAWQACDRTPIDDAELADRMCFGGLDMSSNTDLTAFVLLFPPQGDDDRWIIRARHWIPEGNLAHRVRKDHAPYDVWLKLRQLEATAGTAIDDRVIIDEVISDAQRFSIREIGFDRWGAQHVFNRLTEAGINMVALGQGYQTMNAPTKELMTLVLGQKLRHQGNRPLEWMAGNLCVQTDPAGNVKPDKARSTEKIDGMVALIMAIDRAMRHGALGTVSAFEADDYEVRVL